MEIFVTNSLDLGTIDKSRMVRTHSWQLNMKHVSGMRQEAAEAISRRHTLHKESVFGISASNIEDMIAADDEEIFLIINSLNTIYKLAVIACQGNWLGLILFYLLFRDLLHVSINSSKPSLLIRERLIYSRMNYYMCVF